MINILSLGKTILLMCFLFLTPPYPICFFQAKDFLKLWKQFEELGFKGDDIKRELIVHNNNQEKVLDSLTAWDLWYPKKICEGYIVFTETDQGKK